MTWGLFHDATTSAMKGENTSQNDNSDWSPFHWTTSDKRNATSKLQQSDSKYEPLDECLFQKDIFLSETLVIVWRLLTEVGNMVRLVRFRWSCEAEDNED